VEGKAAEPLHHRDAGFSLGDKYLAVASELDGIVVGTSGTSNIAQQYISIYDVVGSATAVHTPVFDVPGTPSGAATPTTALNSIGTLIFVSTWGNYLIAGGSAGGTAVFEIVNTAGVLSLNSVETADSEAAHWAISNGKYVLESKAGTSTAGKVKVWKWNGTTAPTVVGTASTGSSGSVRGFSFDAEDDTAAYAFGVGSAGAEEIGKIFKIALNSSAMVTEICKITAYQASVRGGAVTNTVGMIWTLEHRTSGSDHYYILSGAANTTTSGGVLVLKNPSTTTVNGTVDATNTTAIITVDTQYASAVRTMKTFKTSGGDVYYAAKNYCSNPIATAPYALQLRKVNTP
jgi:hypothetical protein